MIKKYALKSHDNVCKFVKETRPKF